MSGKTEQDGEDMRLELEDINMDDLEDTAFLNGYASQGKQQGKKLSWTRFVIRKIGLLVEVAGIFKVVIILGSIFLIALVMLAIVNREDNSLPEKLPRKSTEKARKVVEQLKNTAIPSFVLTYAPIIILDRKETFFPSDLSIHLANTQPTYNFTPISNSLSPLNLSNLNQLNEFRNGDVYLSSREPIVHLPKWLRGQKPNKKTLQTKKSINCVVVVVEKYPVKDKAENNQHSVVDAFYLYFYSFNDGPRGLGHQVGNHVGDWEHNMIRFTNGTPSAIWYSQHGFGAAYTYDAVQKIGGRPVVFSARGSHSNWPEAKAHDFHVIYKRIPPHIAYDYTSVGHLWDPTLSALFYTYNSTNTTFSQSIPDEETHSRSNGTYIPAKSSMPTGFLYFNGKWGDQQLKPGDEGQEEIRGFYKWTSGPKGIGWGDKDVLRDTICPKVLYSNGIPSTVKEGEKNAIRECVIKDSL
ncbi:putative vacuolar protein sorting-associated protein TDA6 [Erysiphe neolycopersici]|uniref:Putative vacuolar protein sorting-associated protein TDA6 n=1 Tax=Erysiphe neolycopersici TaxID=212602 RepID=A0A420HP06_9PEZI|nr:putative vacuolar protein sorting-associated protein TDA6 [Erysiphe neolycopersici]